MCLTAQRVLQSGQGQGTMIMSAHLTREELEGKVSGGSGGQRVKKPGGHTSRVVVTVLVCVF